MLPHTFKCVRRYLAPCVVDTTYLLIIWEFSDLPVSPTTANSVGDWNWPQCCPPQLFSCEEKETSVLFPCATYRRKWFQKWSWRGSYTVQVLQESQDKGYYPERNLSKPLCRFSAQFLLLCYGETNNFSPALDRSVTSWVCVLKKTHPLQQIQKHVT